MFLIIFIIIGLIVLLFLYCACILSSKGERYEKNKDNVEEFLGK